MGASAGFILRKLGREGRPAGNWPPRRIDRGLHVARRRIDIPVQVELQSDDLCIRAGWSMSFR